MCPLLDRPRSCRGHAFLQGLAEFNPTVPNSVPGVTRFA